MLRGYKWEEVYSLVELWNIHQTSNDVNREAEEFPLLGSITGKRLVEAD
jgi:hypothetical protein